MTLIKQNEKDKLLEQVKTAVLTLAPNAEIILYGSRAKGTARTDSDWDFLILLPSPQDIALGNQIQDRLYDVELETNSVLSSIIRSKQEWLSARYAALPLRQQIEQHGVVL
ncbi:nucleotidyltransferase domain-containing protein [Candidatus Leptofilum sp.]|uniref:nucleotidyltransferase domain-containing protein n=1 Tax=Candidatus Leptofilum sp. TaxID=3241576 RepID=UPI003B58BF6E